MKIPPQSLTAFLLALGSFSKAKPSSPETGIYITGHGTMRVKLIYVEASHLWTVRVHDELTYSDILETPLLIKFIRDTFESTEEYAEGWLRAEYRKTLA